MGNRVVGAVFFSPTDAASQEAAVCSVQRVVMVRTRAPRDSAVQRCREYLGSEHPHFELEGSVRSVVQFEGVLPEAAQCVRYAPLTSMDRSALWLTSPPRYMNSFVWLYT